ncbi:MAG: RDD family protein [Bdellovibrio sp.]|nr:RDD family protein [Methylotenera sp.]
MNQNASRLKLFAACVYELLLLIALWMLCTWAFISLFGEATTGNKRYILQLILWMITGAYFVFCWHKSGQTLATKTWKIKLVNQQSNSLSLRHAIVRYALASALMLAGGLSLFWMLVDKDRLFLHDRLLKTRFIETKLL